MTDKQPDWASYSFGELTPARLYSIIKLRQEVFILEQTCLYRDLDDLDQDSHHLCAWQDSELYAYLRAVPPGLCYAESALSRIVVSPAARGMKLGGELVRRGIALNHQLWPGQDIRIGAQAHLQAFYRELGFVTDSDVYEEDGILHVKMLLQFTP